MLNPMNIFKVVTEKYPKKEPKKNHRIDPIYSLFERKTPRPDETEMAFFTDTSICSGCKACEVACKQWNQIPVHDFIWSKNSYDNTKDLSAVNWRHVEFIERFPEHNELDRPAPKNIDNLLKEQKPGEWLFMSNQCKHCQESPCHEACPTGAIIRNEFGGIYYQTDICMGCNMCVANCPFGVPELSPDSGHSIKCMECYDRLRDGLTPACALACTTGAIEFGPREEMVQKARARLEFLHAHGDTKANLYGADGFADYSPLNSFYLLRDKPEVYGLPMSPTTPSHRQAGDYLRGIFTLVFCAVCIACAMY